MLPVKLLKTLLPFLLFFLVVAILRSFAILKFPIYLDEGIYLSWAKLFAQSKEYAYVSLNDGKTPLFMWITALASRWFVTTLQSGRMVSAIAGAGTAVVWASITALLFGKKQRNVYMLFSLIVPYLYFVERMAFVDSLLTFFWSLSFLFWLLMRLAVERKERLMLVAAGLCALLTGGSLAFGYMTKTSARLFLIITIFLGLVWVGEFLWKRKIVPAIITLLGIGMMYGAYHELISYMHIGAARFWMGIAMKEAELTSSPSEMLKTLLTTPLFYLQSIESSLQYMSVYLVGVCVLFLVSIYFLFRKKGFLKTTTGMHALWLFLIIILGFGASIMAGKVIASRYFFPLVPPILAFTTLGTVWILEQKHKWSRYVLIALLGSTALVSSILIFAPSSFPYAANERTFGTGDISAYGLDEVTQIINKQDSIIGVAGIWGVKDGSVITLRELGFQAVGVYRTMISSESGRLQTCPPGTTYAEKRCWKLESGELINQPQSKKYLFITDMGSHPEIVEQLPGISIVKEFIRPQGNLKTYLLQIQ